MRLNLVVAMILLNVMKKVQCYNIPQSDMLRKYRGIKVETLQGDPASDHFLIGTNQGIVTKCGTFRINEHDRPKLDIHHHININHKGRVRRISCDSNSHHRCLIDIDPIEDNETSRTYMLDKTTGKILFQKTWKDSTSSQTIIADKYWIRCDMFGKIFRLDIERYLNHAKTRNTRRHRDFLLMRRLSSCTDDYVCCSRIVLKRLVTMTTSGRLQIIDLSTFETITEINTELRMPTCIHMESPFDNGKENNDGHGTFFVYAGNSEGNLLFCQITEGKLQNTTIKKLGDAVMTDIHVHQRMFFITYMDDDSNIVGYEKMSFKEKLIYPTCSRAYPYKPVMCISKNKIIYIWNDQYIRIEDIVMP